MIRLRKGTGRARVQKQSARTYPRQLSTVAGLYRASSHHTIKTFPTYEAVELTFVCRVLVRMFITSRGGERHAYRGVRGYLSFFSGGWNTCSALEVFNRVLVGIALINILRLNRICVSVSVSVERRSSQDVGSRSQDVISDTFICQVCETIHYTGGSISFCECLTNLSGIKR